MSILPEPVGPWTQEETMALFEAITVTRTQAEFHYQLGEWNPEHLQNLLAQRRLVQMGIICPTEECD